jgi:hypothetical protein
MHPLAVSSVSSAVSVRPSLGPADIRCFVKLTGFKMEMATHVIKAVENFCSESVGCF